MLRLSEMIKLGQQETILTVDERLPAFLAPCQLNVGYFVESKGDYYLIHLNVKGNLITTCQRCTDEFNFPYDNSTIVAVCRTDERAEQLLEQYECIVSANGQIDLKELIVDELHLYAPSFHIETGECNQQINEFLIEDNFNN